MAARMKRFGLPATLLMTVVAALPLLIAPPLVRGFAADAWVKHYAAMEHLPAPRRNAARALVKKTDIAIQYLAPLPQASAAAIRALEVGQRVQQRDRDRESALLIYRGVRASCVRVRDRAFTGVGFAVVEARAAALEASAKEPSSR